MKSSLIVIAITIPLQFVFGQINYGTYKLSSDTIGFGNSRNFSEIVINRNHTFVYKYRTSLSCFVWYDSKGKWEFSKNNLALIDSVWSYHPVVDFTKSVETSKRQITLIVKGKDQIPIQGIVIEYKFKDSEVTQEGITDEEGKFLINTAGIKEKIHNRNDSVRSVDDVEIWIRYVDKRKIDRSTNTFTTLSEDIECIIDDSAVDEKIVRTTTYQVIKDELIYVTQSFSKPDAQPGQYLFGNFKFSDR